jgi:hypothetical protein
MKCTSKDCKYYVYDECIRKNVTIDKGVCPYYSTQELHVSDVFHTPIHGVWGLTSETGEELVVKGHLLNAVVAWQSHYTIVRPLRGHTHGLGTPKKQGVFDVTMYLRFIDSGIAGMYLEDFVLDYLAHSYYTIQKINCSGQFVHLVVEGT